MPPADMHNGSEVVHIRDTHGVHTYVKCPRCHCYIAQTDIIVNHEQSECRWCSLRTVRDTTLIAHPLTGRSSLHEPGAKNEDPLIKIKKVIQELNNIVCQNKGTKQTEARQYK
ncbi:MAG: hypothetical protein JW795_02320 [Chitinivibrionales bacterium]|nr:hypothetical protein [Chitinivibrionales bacterium]